MRAEYTASKMPPFCLLEEPLLTFNPDDTSLDVNPLRGLDQYGAYSSLTFQSYTSSLRIATMAPSGAWANLRSLVNTLRSAHTPSDRKEYVPTFRGFEKIFAVPLVAAQAEAHIRWADDLSSDGPPHVRLLHAMKDGMGRLSLVRDQFDVLMVYLLFFQQPVVALTLHNSEPLPDTPGNLMNIINTLWPNRQHIMLMFISRVIPRQAHITSVSRIILKSWNGYGMTCINPDTAIGGHI